MKPTTTVVTPRQKLARAWLLFMLGATTACDTSFSPLQDDQMPFSISGVLDAKADTQLIRVTAIRDSVGTTGAPIDARVTLTDLATNTVTELRDSLVKFTSPDPDRLDDLYAHVFWTTYPIEAGQRYLLTASRSDGEQSSVVVQVPPEITSVSVDIRLSNARNVLSDYVEVEGPEHVALLYVLHYRVVRTFQDVAPNVRLSETRNRRMVSRLARGIDPDPIICTKGRLCDIRIISSGAEWPFNPQFTDDAILYGEIGNIVNGAGFVDGINSIVVPYESVHTRRADGAERSVPPDLWRRLRLAGGAPLRPRMRRRSDRRRADHAEAGRWRSDPRDPQREIGRIPDGSP
jgi:hypothetical protein